MTQEEFNRMLNVAIQQGAVPGGYFTLSYSGEEVQALLDKVAALPANK